jgi:hypothetical protein
MQTRTVTELINEVRLRTDWVDRDRATMEKSVKATMLNAATAGYVSISQRGIAFIVPVTSVLFMFVEEREDEHSLPVKIEM